MKRLTGVAAVVVALAVAVLAPVPARVDRAVRSPRAAAARTEATLPRLGLGWGRLRGWERAGAGWRVVWQPAHGAWLLRAWVPDGAGQTGWWLDVAPWLPGARLSQAAAAAIAANDGEPVPNEQLGRRDWVLGEQRVVGGLSAGRRVAAPRRERTTLWGAVLAGLLFAGAISRVLVPVAVAPGWRQLIGWTAIAAIVALPLMVPLSARRFEVGVRPFVSELVFGATVAVVLAAVAIAAVRYPAGRGRAPGMVLGLALAAGLLAGRLEPIPWCAEVAGLSARPLVWLAVVILGGWVVGLAGEGLRQLAAPAGRADRLVLAVFGAATVISAGPWLGAGVAIVGAAAGGRGQGTPVGALTLWGWVVGATWAACAWTGPSRDSLLLLLAGVAIVVAATLVDTRHRV
jgi:hypothetical protein